jgi:hypothetical protein
MTDIFDEVFAEDEDQQPAPAEELPVETDEEIEAPIEALAEVGQPEDNPEPEPEDEAESPEETDYKALYEKAEQRFKSFEGRYKKEKEAWEQRIVQPAPAREEPKEVEAPPEEAFLAKFREEYNDDVIKAVELISERKARALLDAVSAERIEPLQQAYAKTAREAHFNTIRSAHSDWEDVVGSDAFTGWVDQQPSFMKAAYNQVLQQGTAQDVNDLLTTFKQTTAKPTKPNIDPAKARAASAVKTARGVMPTGSPKRQDYDSAWDEAPD